VVGLVGPLGAGKTVFARGLAEGLGLDTTKVTSPSFVIAAHHEGARGRRFVHVDLYRVESRQELDEAGWLDWIAPGTVVAVEWADRFESAMPEDHVWVRLERGAGEERRLDLHASGPRARRALARFLEAA
jgi:tRNA threonylcarbamoyladenosine biosynthesis protein TsaE